jgi:hypothetical protein
VLPQGTVLILGGTDTAGVVDFAELFDPITRQFQVVSTGGPSARAYHTATLLTDGRVLIAGGVSRDGGLVQEIEL